MEKKQMVNPPLLLSIEKKKKKIEDDHQPTKKLNITKNGQYTRQ